MDWDMSRGRGGGINSGRDVGVERKPKLTDETAQIEISKQNRLISGFSRLLAKMLMRDLKKAEKCSSKNTRTSKQNLAASRSRENEKEVGCQFPASSN